MSAVVTSQRAVPRLRLGVACDSAHIGYDGKLHVDGIFDRIAVPRVPARHLHFFLAALVEAAPGIHTVLLELWDPDGRCAMQDDGEDGVEVPLDVIDTHGTLVAEMTNLPLMKAGLYTFTLSIGGEHVGSIPLTVEAWTPQH